MDILVYLWTCIIQHSLGEKNIYTVCIGDLLDWPIWNCLTSLTRAILRTGEPENLVAAQSMRLAATAVPVWCWKPRRFMQRYWYSAHVGCWRSWVPVPTKNGNIGLDALTKEWRLAAIADLMFPQTSLHQGQLRMVLLSLDAGLPQPLNPSG